MVIKRVSPISAAKVLGLLYGLFGLIIGGCISLVMMASGALAASRPSGAFFGAFFGAAAIIVVPVFYGAMGFIGGAIGAGLYNLVAGWTGGIELEAQ